MTRAAITLFALAAFACGPQATPPPSGPRVTIARRVTLEEGAALSPDDPAKPGEASPGALVLAGGRLYTVLQNLDHYAAAGPSFLAILDPETLATLKLVALVVGQGPDQLSCRDAGALFANGDTLLVACAGRIALPPATTADGTLAEVGLDGTVRRIVQVGRSPDSVTRIGNDVWIGDAEGGGLAHVAYDTFAVLAGAGGQGLVVACERGETKSGFVSDVAAVSGRLFATCFNDDTVLELDPRTGARLGRPLATGAGPRRLAPLGPDLAVLDNLGGTLTRLAPGPPPTAQRAMLYLGLDGTQGGNDPQGIAGDASVAGVTNSAYGTFVLLELSPAPRLVASVDLKPGPDAPTNYPGAVAYDGHDFFVAIPGLEFDTRNVPSEIVRLTVER